MFNMVTYPEEVGEEVMAVRRAIIQCVTDMGLLPYSETGKRLIAVRYLQPSRMALGVIKPVYITVAEIKVLPVINGVCQIFVRPRLYGHDRPRVDELVSCLRNKEVECVRLEVIIQN